MRPHAYDIDLIDVDPDGIAENQTLAGAGNLTLNGALCDLGTSGQFDILDAGYSSGVGGVQIAIDSAGDVSSVVFTVTGKDENGRAVTETITGVTTAAVESTTYWSQITQIAADAAVGSDVFVGPVDEASTPTFPLDAMATGGADIAVAVTGTISYTVQECFNDFQTSDLAIQSVDWFPITALESKSADAVGSTHHSTGCRLLVSSYSSGAELAMYIVQPED